MGAIEKGESVHELWDARYVDVEKDEEGNIINARVVIDGLTEKGKQQTFLVMPEKINGFPVVALNGVSEGFMSNSYKVEYGNVIGIVFEKHVPIASGVLQYTFTSEFKWIYFRENDSWPLDNRVIDTAINGYSTPKFKVIYPDSYDFDSKIRNESNDIRSQYMNYQHLSDSIAEHRTENDEIWSVFTDERDYVFADDTQFNKNEILIIATDEMETVTFPRGLSKLNRVVIIPSEHQQTGTTIKVYVSEATVLADGAFEDNVEVVRY